MTDQPQHTPGPWVANERGGLVSRVDGQAICIVSWPDDLCTETTKANARLIAAAPEMQAELKRQRALIAELVAAGEEAAHQLHYLTPGELGDRMGLLSQLRAAIAKAKGETQ